MPGADTLDEDVHALKLWLSAAWRQLGDPSLTRFDRRELRNQMKESDAELRVCMQKVLERDRKREQESQVTGKIFQKPAFRFLDF